jgi:hypothetical protein
MVPPEGENPRRFSMATRVKLELDTETFGRLIEAAVTERRPVDFQAEVILMRALGVPPPEVPPSTPTNAASAPTESRTNEAERVPA